MKQGIKILLLADMWATFAIGMLGPIYAIFVERIGGDLLDASWAFFAFMITSGVVMYFISHWEDHVLHKERLVTLGYTMTAVGCLMYVFVDSQLMLIMTQIVLGLAEAVLVPAYDAMYSHFLDVEKAASEWGDWEAMRYIVTALAAVAGGYVVHLFGFSALFIIMAIVASFAAITSVWLYKQTT